MLIGKLFARCLKSMTHYQAYLKQVAAGLS
jgi:hypothetical protein